MLKVKHDGSAPGEVMEHCCMCRAKTRYWYTPKDVAMCPECARTTKRDQVPTKQEWCEKERKLNPRWY